MLADEVGLGKTIEAASILKVFLLHNADQRVLIAVPRPLIEQWNAMAPMGRLGKPEELESICVYLAGDTSTFTTGSDFIVDGAFTCF